MHDLAAPINYTQMYQILTDEIQAHKLQEPFLGSWLTNEQKHDILAEWTVNSATDIESIVEPYAKTQFDYPEPDFNRFAHY